MLPEPITKKGIALRVKRLVSLVSSSSDLTVITSLAGPPIFKVVRSLKFMDRLYIKGKYGKLAIMEKAVLRTLIYADIFDYPMKVWEIQKWIIGRKATFKQVEKTLEKMYQVSRIKYYGDYYFLKGRRGLVKERVARQKISERLLKQARLISQIFKIIPWIKLVGVSGSLAMENADKNSDIDLFIITEKNKLWICRLGLLGILELLGKRRKRGENEKQASGKICINLLLEEDSLAQKDKNIYLAHEVLQMRVLWQRGGVYSKFLEENEWVFKYLPNWTSSVGIKYQVLSIKGSKKFSHNTYYILHNTLGWMERIAKWLQLRYMGAPKGKEQIKDGALYFHPEDIGPKVSEEYNRKLKAI